MSFINGVSRSLNELSLKESPGFAPDSRPVSLDPTHTRVESEKRALFKARRILIDSEDVFDVEEEAKHFPLRMSDIGMRLQYYEFEIERERKIKEGIQKVINAYKLNNSVLPRYINAPTENVTGSAYSLNEKKPKKLSKTSQSSSQIDLLRSKPNFFGGNRSPSVRSRVASNASNTSDTISVSSSINEDFDKVTLSDRRIKAFEELLQRLKQHKKSLFRLELKDEAEMPEASLKRIDRLNDCLSHSIVRRDFDQEYEVENRVIEGLYCDSFIAMSKRSKTRVFIKQTKSLDFEDVEFFVNEISVQKQLSSPYILTIHSFYFDGVNSRFQLVMEYFESCPVGTYILKHSLSEAQISCIASQALQALHYLHSVFVPHKNFKCSNILIGKKGRVKVCDTGICFLKGQDTITRDPYWLAPEVIKNQKLSCKSDIWAYGISLIEMAETYPPYFIDSLPATAASKIVEKNPPTLRHEGLWSKDFNHFLSKCLVKDDLLRGATTTLLAHPFITSVKGNEVLQQVVNNIERDSSIQVTSIVY